MQYNLSSPALTAGGTVTAIPAAFRRVNVEINYQSVNAGGIKTQQVKEKCSSEQHKFRELPMWMEKNSKGYD